MKKINDVILSVLLIISLSACADNTSWNGDYSYEASLGGSVAGEALIVEYALSVKKNDCFMQIAGYQVYESIICAIEETKQGLQVRFVSFADGAIKNKYDVAVYPVGSMLFSLEMNGDQLVTTWGELLPDESLGLKGHYFAKQ